MKYTKFNQANQNTLQLQSIGHVLGTPAGELKTGDFLMWNFGEKTEVVEIVKETNAMIFIKEKCKSGTYERKLKKSRLVCRLSL